MVKHTQIIRRLLPVNCLTMFDHFVGWRLKGICEVGVIFFNKIHNLLPDKEIRISIKLKQKYVVFLQDKKSPEYSSLSGNVEEAVSLFRVVIYLFFVCFLLQIAFPSSCFH